MLNIFFWNETEDVSERLFKVPSTVGELREVSVTVELTKKNRDCLGALTLLPWE